MEITHANKRRTVYVGGLDKEVTEDMLNSAFIPFGPINQVHIPHLPGAPFHKGHGFVRFEEVDDAKAAIDNMDDSEFFGRVLRVKVSVPKGPELGSLKPVWAQMEEINRTVGKEEPDEDEINDKENDKKD